MVTDLPEKLKEIRDAAAIGHVARAVNNHTEWAEIYREGFNKCYEVMAEADSSLNELKQSNNELKLVIEYGKLQKQLAEKDKDSYRVSKNYSKSLNEMLNLVAEKDALIVECREALEYGAKDRNPNIYKLMGMCMDALEKLNQSEGQDSTCLKHMWDDTERECPACNLEDHI